MFPSENTILLTANVNKLHTDTLLISWNPNTFSNLFNQAESKNKLI